MSEQLAVMAMAAYLIGCAAWLGSHLGDAIRAHDERRRETRDAIDALIAESDRYRAEARRKLWAA